MFKIWNNSPSHWKTLVSREQIVHYLETVQDLIVILLCIGMFSIMLIRMGELFFSLMHPLQFQAVTSDILFLLILVELFRLLIIYLQERRISVGVAVEVSIVSALREVILRGIVEIPSGQLWAICGFLAVLGGLLIIRALQARIFKTVGYSENNPRL
ncbi:phosphate-starvation-inducible PsiE family protein [Fischerella sp. PCC 9605]|uniref:phosphate-starvation-inducible PsiE family protein n=1 Tax=Fischerella sp. PCC 9605 TaxID=1173024 RepID=UPI00047C1DC8|nr:phosphate-starvation-inducible PsiE family protein [Fischerella sp. PCC 9605]